MKTILLINKKTGEQKTMDLDDFLAEFKWFTIDRLRNYINKGYSMYGYYYSVLEE